MHQSLENLVGKVERLTRTDIRYLASGGFWLSSGQVTSVLVAFGLSVLFANILSKEEYGIYRYIFSITSIIAAFSLTGLGTALVQSVARGYGGALKQAFRLNLKWSVFMCAGFAVTAGYYFFQKNYVLGTALVVGGLATPFIQSGNLFTNFLNGKKDFRRLSLYGMLKNLFPALLVAGALLFTRDIVTLVALYFGANLLGSLFFFFRTVSVYPPTNQYDKELVPFAKKLSALNLLAVFTAHLDKVLVFTMLGGAQLAIYGIAVSFPEQIKGLFKNLSTLMIPRFAEREAATLELRRKLWQLALLLAGVTLVYIIIAPFLYKIFFPTYTESIAYSRIFALSIITGIAMIPNSLIIAHKKEREWTLVSILGSGVQLVVLFPAVYFWGLWGLIIARTLTAYINTLIPILVARKGFHL